MHQSEVYLTGLDGRNYFDLRAMHFQVQEDTLDDQLSARNDEQPWVLPSLRLCLHARRAGRRRRADFNVNAQVIRRDELDYVFRTCRTRVRGIEGNDGRLTAEAEWKKSLITDGGLVITPMFDVRGDARLRSTPRCGVQLAGHQRPGVQS